MTTELEAMQNKICPLTLGLGADNKATCLGSTCMAWQWQPVTLIRNGLQKFISATNRQAKTEIEARGQESGFPVPDNWEFYPAEIERAGWLEPEKEAFKRRLGFCGMCKSA